MIIAHLISNTRSAKLSNNWIVPENSFSNSLIIQEEKTKEITKMKEVCICDPNIIVIKFGELLL